MRRVPWRVGYVAVVATVALSAASNALVWGQWAIYGAPFPPTFPDVPVPLELKVVSLGLWAFFVVLVIAGYRLLGRRRAWANLREEIARTPRWSLVLTPLIAFIVAGPLVTLPVAAALTWLVLPAIEWLVG